MQLLISLCIILIAWPTMLLASNDVKICLTGRVEKNFPSYKQALINSVNLAVDNSDVKENIHVKSFFYDDSPLSSIDSYYEMLEDNCSAIIGFEYLSDLLLVEASQQNAKIPIFTSYASGLTNTEFKENIFIFRPSYNVMSRKMIEFLIKKFGNVDSVLLVTQVSRDSMKEYKSAYTNQFDKLNIKYDTFDFVENDSELTDKFIKYLDTTKKKYKFIFLLSGAIDSVNIANVIEDKDPVIIGTENFGSSNAASFYLRLTDKEKQIYFIRNLDFLNADAELTSFGDMYTETYLSKPLLISAYTYDATQIILKSYEEFGEITLTSIRKLNYKGITGVKINQGQFNNSAKYIILKSTNIGYEKSYEALS